MPITQKEKKSVLEALKTKNKSKLRQEYFKALDILKELASGDLDYEFITQLAKRMLKIKIKEHESFVLEKLLINFCYKKFNAGLFELVEKQILKARKQFIQDSGKSSSQKDINELTSFANLYIPYAIVKKKFCNETPKDTDYFLKFCDSKLRLKFISITTQEGVCVVNFEEVYKQFSTHRHIINHRATPFEKFKCCDYGVTQYFSLELFESRTNNIETSKLMELKTASVFRNTFERDIAKCLSLLLDDNRLLEAKTVLKDLKTTVLFANHVEIRFHVYNLLIMCQLECAEYFECLTYIDLCLNQANSLDLWLVYFYFLNLHFFIERLGGFQGPKSCLTLKVRSLEELKPLIDNSTNELDDLYLAKQILNFRLKAKIELAGLKDKLREFRNIETSRLVDVKALLNRRKEACKGYTIISLHIIDDLLYVYDHLEGLKETHLEFRGLSDKLNSILSISKTTLKRKAETRREKADWWIERLNLDTKLERLLRDVNIAIEIQNTHVIIILDEQCTNFPWEHTAWLRLKHVTRLPSLEFIDFKNINVAIDGVNWIIDPDNNLEDTRKRITNYFNQSQLEQSNQNYNVVLYFGHGGGSKHLKNVKNKILFLFGCSSSKILNVTNFKRNGKALGHLERGNTVIGCLWEVTDRDLDLISINIIDNLFNGKCIACIIKDSIDTGRLKYLNGCALVVYGHPTVLNKC